MRSILPAFILLAALVITGAWLTLRPPLAPPAAFAVIDGSKPSLADWRGKPALIAFWATDCPTCIKEIPALKQLHQRYAPRGLHLVASAMPYDMPSHVVSFAQSYELPYAVALDPAGENAAAFQVQATPTTLLLDDEGRIVERILGDFDPARLANRIEALLEES
ncbi:TlpA disulfide reductase family protein [Methylogaea oryzae]|nr:TlpA disulfide reductase family protein [Methylogaea oryzae]